MILLRMDQIEEISMKKNHDILSASKGENIINTLHENQEDKK